MGYGTGFDARGTFLFPDGSFAQNVIIFGVDMSSSEGLTQELDDTTLTAEKNYSINFTKSNAIFCLSLHYNGENSYLFVNGTEIHNFKAKEYEIKDNQTEICLGIISTDFSVNNMKKTVLYGNIRDFSADFTPITVNNILDIHKYLMKKNDI